MARFRPLFLPVALTALLLLLAAGPQIGRVQAQEEIELRVWDQFTEDSSPVLDSIYEGFTELHPNITIVREAVSGDQMAQTLSTALASGTGPDLVNSDASPARAGLLADAGLILPLDDLAAQYGWIERFVPLAIDAATIDGQLYSLPLTIDIIGLYYNQTLMEEEGFQVPETVEDLIAFCGEATDAGYVPIAFANNPGWQAFHQFSMTTNSILGPEATRQLLVENQGSWDSPEVVTAIQTFFVDMNEAGCFNEDPNALTYDDGAEIFYTGEALMTPTGSWLVNNIQANMPDDEVGFVPFPALAGAEQRVWPAGVGSAYLVSAATEHPEEVGMLLDYLYSPETVARFVGEASFFVPLEVDTAAMTVTPLFNSVLEVFRSAAAGEIELGYSLDVLTPPQFNDVMQNGFQAVLAGDKTPEEQAADLQAAWEEGLAAQGTPAP